MDNFGLYNCFIFGPSQSFASASYLVSISNIFMEQKYVLFNRWQENEWEITRFHIVLCNFVPKISF